MAQIKCEECGQLISERASSCPNCGCPVEKIVCHQCGENVGSHDKFCPNCGCSIIASNTDEEEIPIPEHSEELETRVRQFLVQNKKYLPVERMKYIRSRLFTLNDKQWATVEWLTFKEPTTMILISIFIGGLGVDRFMLEDTLNGVLKLLLTLCCGVGIIWWLIDIFQISDKTLSYNYRLLTDTINYA